MRCFALLPLVLLAIGLSCPRLHAGLYNTHEPLVIPVSDQKSAAAFVGYLRSIRAYGPPDMVTMKQATRERRDYLAKAHALRKKEAHEGLTVAEQINLGAYLIRLLRLEFLIEIGPLAVSATGGFGPVRPSYDEATNVLRGALRRAEEDSLEYFHVNANLGTLWMHVGELGQAVNSLQVAEDQARHLKLPEAVFEHYQLRLAQMRLRERDQFGDRFRGREPLDSLFDARFVGPSGQWQIGCIADEQRAKLPGGSIDEAIRIVQQLLLCLPADARLHWQLGELANARGDLRGALAAMQVAVDDLRFSNPLLLVRRQLLDQYLNFRDVLDRLTNPGKEAWWHERLLADHPAVRRRADALWVSGTILAAAAAGLPTSPEWTLVRVGGRTPPLPALDFGLDESRRRPAAGLLTGFGWKAWTAVAVVGVVVCWLAFVQWRQLLRRFRPRPPSGPALSASASSPR